MFPCSRHARVGRLGCRRSRGIFLRGISKITKTRPGHCASAALRMRKLFRVRRLLLSQIVPAFIEFNALVPSGNPGSNGFNEGFRGH